MTVKVSRWDSAEYLKTDDDTQAYLEAVCEEAGNPTFTTVAKIVKALGLKIKLQSAA